MLDDNTNLTAQQAAGLRSLADMIEAHPEFAGALRYTNLSEINIPVATAENPRAVIRSFARAGKQFGAEVKKKVTDNWAGVLLIFDPISLCVYAKREQVCRRVIVGTETVTKKIPDPEALKDVPQIEVTETEEQYEWLCEPLLAEDVAAERHGG